MNMAFHQIHLVQASQPDFNGKATNDDIGFRPATKTILVCQTRLKPSGCDFVLQTILYRPLENPTAYGSDPAGIRAWNAHFWQGRHEIIQA